MKLTSNFSLSEFTKSPTAIKNGIINEPSKEQINKLRALCENVLQPLRNNYGKGININSGFRSIELNAKIGGARSSQHMSGEAADIDTINDNADLFFHIRHNIKFDQLIWEFGDRENPAWIHVSYCKGNNRNSVLRAERINNRTTYTKMT